MNNLSSYSGLTMWVNYYSRMRASDTDLPVKFTLSQAIKLVHCLKNIAPEG